MAGVTSVRSYWVATASRVSRLTPWYSIAERVVEALQLRHPLLEGHLAALEAAGDRVAGALALGAAAGGLAAVAADAPADAPLGAWLDPGAGFRSSTRISALRVRATRLRR